MLPSDPDDNLPADCMACTMLLQALQERLAQGEWQDVAGYALDLEAHMQEHDSWDEEEDDATTA